MQDGVQCGGWLLFIILEEMAICIPSGIQATSKQIFVSKIRTSIWKADPRIPITLQLYHLQNAGGSPWCKKKTNTSPLDSKFPWEEHGKLLSCKLNSSFYPQFSISIVWKWCKAWVGDKFIKFLCHFRSVWFCADCRWQSVSRRGALFRDIH